MTGEHDVMGWRERYAVPAGLVLGGFTQVREARCQHLPAPVPYGTTTAGLKPGTLCGSKMPSMWWDGSLKCAAAASLRWAPVCRRCRLRAEHPERIPDAAFRLDEFMALTGIDGPDGRWLDFATVLFVDAGSMLWVEDDYPRQPRTDIKSAVLAVAPAAGGPVVRYRGVWLAAKPGPVETSF